MYGKAIDVIERRLGSGEIGAEEAGRIIKQLAKAASRCPEASLRQRLAVVLERLRAEMLD